jgi:hypothetical protein
LSDHDVTLVLAPGSLDHLADAVAERVAERIADRPAAPDRWMEAAEAARHIGRSVAALHKLTAARRIPFSQDGPGAKCYFRRSDLDRWMAGQGAPLGGQPKAR